MKLSGGAPTISFRDVTIQRRENDLVAASFGRGFFVLDDYSALRDISVEALDNEALLFEPNLNFLTGKKKYPETKIGADRKYAKNANRKYASTRGITTDFVPKGRAGQKELALKETRRVSSYLSSFYQRNNQRSLHS